MSSENVQLVRSMFNHWNRDAQTPPHEQIAEDFELHSPMAAQRGEPYRGAAGVSEWIADLNDRFGRFIFELDELLERDGRVLALGRIEVEARGSAAGLDRGAGWLIDLSNGKLTRIVVFLDRQEARAAFRDA